MLTDITTTTSGTTLPTAMSSPPPSTPTVASTGEMYTFMVWCVCVCVCMCVCVCVCVCVYVFSKVFCAFYEFTCFRNFQRHQCTEAI